MILHALPQTQPFLPEPIPPGSPVLQSNQYLGRDLYISISTRGFIGTD